MTTIPEPPVPVRPSRAKSIVLGLLLLIDAGAVLSLGVLLIDAVSDYEPFDEDLVICAGLMIVVVAFIAGALVMMRRGRAGIAIALAAVPAVPTVLATAAVLLFMATFHHQQ